MTGVYLRVQRDGKWLNIEVEHLTKDERIKLFIKRQPDELLRWMDLLCDTIKESQVLFDGLVADGILTTETKDETKTHERTE